MKHNLKYPLENLNGQKITEAYPALAAYKEFANCDDKLLAYVIYAYDKGSAFIKTADPKKRREQALKEAGFKEGKDPIWDSIVNFTNQEVRPIILRFLRSVMHERKYAYWVNGNEMVWQNIRKIGEPIEEEETPGSIEVGENGISIEEARKMVKGGEKEKDIQSAYNTRNAIYKELPAQMKLLEEIEMQIFLDKDTREAAEEESESLNAGFMEAWANENSKKKK